MTWYRELSQADRLYMVGVHKRLSQTELSVLWVLLHLPDYKVGAISDLWTGRLLEGDWTTASGTWPLTYSRQGVHKAIKGLLRRGWVELTEQSRYRSKDPALQVLQIPVLSEAPKWLRGADFSGDKTTRIRVAESGVGSRESGDKATSQRPWRARFTTIEEAGRWTGGQRVLLIGDHVRAGQIGAYNGCTHPVIGKAYIEVVMSNGTRVSAYPGQFKKTAAVKASTPVAKKIVFDSHSERRAEAAAMRAAKRRAEPETDKDGRLWFRGVSVALVQHEHGTPSYLATWQGFTRGVPAAESYEAYRKKRRTDPARMESAALAVIGDRWWPAKHDGETMVDEGRVVAFRVSGNSTKATFDVAVHPAKAVAHA